MTAALSAILLSACGSTGSGAVAVHRPPNIRHPSGSAFAGYSVQGTPVAIVAAGWRVPAVTLTSGPGYGSTWIGVQQQGGFDTPFIQIGTTAYRDSQDDDEYTAFWSDTAHHFRPHTLFQVAADDQIVATLTRRRGRWVARIVDRTLHVDRTITTAQEASAPLYQADWYQEDPSRPGSRGRAHLPYATTGRVRFADLILNGAVPSAALLVPQAMQLPRGTLAPSSPSGDGFVIR